VLLRNRAFVSLLRCTGMRSITAVTLRMDQFSETERMERKCGSTRDVEKPILVCVVPHADPKLCPIVHLAAAVGERTDPTYELFAEGFVCRAVVRRALVPWRDGRLRERGRTRGEPGASSTSWLCCHWRPRHAGLWRPSSARRRRGGRVRGPAGSAVPSVLPVPRVPARSSWACRAC
jgi:hypothetical protein